MKLSGIQHITFHICFCIKYFICKINTFSLKKQTKELHTVSFDRTLVSSFQNIDSDNVTGTLPFRHPECLPSDTRNASLPTPGMLLFRHPEQLRPPEQPVQRPVEGKKKGYPARGCPSNNLYFMRIILSALLHCFQCFYLHHNSAYLHSRHRELMPLYPPI